MSFAKRHLQTTKWKNTKINLRPLEKFRARFDHFQESKPCFAFLANPFNVNISVLLPSSLTFVTNVCAAEMKLTEM